MRAPIRLLCALVVLTLVALGCAEDSGRDAADEAQTDDSVLDAGAAGQGDAADDGEASDSDSGSDGSPDEGADDDATGDTIESSSTSSSAPPTSITTTTPPTSITTPTSTTTAPPDGGEEAVEDVRCRITTGPSSGYEGPCLFDPLGGGSFAVSRADESPIVDGTLIVTVALVGEGVAEVRGLTEAGINSRWGEALRSEAEPACWVGSDFEVCAF